MTTRRWKRHSPEQIIAKLRDADALLNAGKDLAVVLQTLELNETTYERWRSQHGGMKAPEAKRLKEPEDENRRSKQIVADQALDIQMLKHIQRGNWLSVW
jgi:putative transposase